MYRSTTSRARLSQLASHLHPRPSPLVPRTTAAMATLPMLPPPPEPPAGIPLKDIAKTAAFTSKLPPDPAFPTPQSSAEAPREKLGPRMVKNALFTWVRPERFTENPELLAVSPMAFRSLGLDPAEANTPQFRNLVAGNGGFEDEVYPWAQCYGGWQFGQWAGQLGDGRAISLFEATNPHNRDRYELQLKGAGTTPYSRFADGKAVLRSSIREFVVSEFLHSIGIPSTRALSITLLPEVRAVRERIEPCAIVCRMAPSWIRFGTFDLFRWRGDRKTLRALADYTREEVLRMPVQPHEDERGNRYEAMYREIARRNARTVARWQVYGFMNGVLNTDNTSVLGLSLDFGPFAFMDAFDPNYTPNHDDHMLRYSFKRQPTIIWWNLVRLGEDLAELIAADDPDDPTFMESGIGPEHAEGASKKAEDIINTVGEEFRAIFLEEYKRLMARRLGLKAVRDTDMDNIFSTCLDMLQKLELDFHHFFRRLANAPVRRIIEQGSPEEKLAFTSVFFPADRRDSASEDDRKEIVSWLEVYAGRLKEEHADDAWRTMITKKWNPRFVPKNWVLDEIIQKVERDGDRDVLRKVVEMIEKPFEDAYEYEDGERWCGDVPTMLRGTQCSCSS